MNYYLYIIRNGEEKYVGITKNIKDRLHKHNSGSCKSTKHLKEWQLDYLEKFNTISEASRKEKEIKRNKKRLDGKILFYRGVAQPG